MTFDRYGCVIPDMDLSPEAMARRRAGRAAVCPRRGDPDDTRPAWMRGETERMMVGRRWQWIGDQDDSDLDLGR